MNEFTGDRLPTFFGYAPSGTASVQEDRLIVASLPVAERRSEHLSTFVQTKSIKSSPESRPPKMADNVLVKNCRMKQWDSAYQRCLTHPQEARPQLREKYNKGPMEMDIDPPLKRERLSQFHGEYYNVPSCKLYDTTALGLVCSATWADTNKMAQMVEVLLAASPDQVQCSQRLHGHTPLRDAVRNPSCTPKVLNLLLDADLSMGRTACEQAAYRNDRDSFEPLDHLIFGIHATDSQHSLDLLKIFMSKTGRHGDDCSCPVSVSPLIRLLSLGTSFGLNETRDSSLSNESSRLVRLVECTRCLIENDVSLLHTRARATQCTALHAALRNYGDVFSLIELLLEHDDENYMIQQRNLYGDLPLHVATSVGVPMQVLRLVLEQTVQSVSRPNEDLPHPLVWSTNISGFTAVDLEWMRHIEGGRGFHEARAFYPLETSGIRWHCSRQDEFYRDLLRDAVGQVITSDNTLTTKSNQERAMEPFGLLFDRIMLLVHVAHRGVVMHPSEQLTRYLLHAASSLARASGPCLPKPLLDLIYWMNPTERSRVDDRGRLPIHYSVMPSTRCDDVALKSTRKDQIEATDYLSWVKFLLKEEPATSGKADRRLRLPLHYALDGCFSGVDAWGRIRAEGDAPEMETPSWQQDVIEHLVDASPESVERRDPQSCLYPFLQAAANPYVSTDIVYILLRRCPSLVDRSHSEGADNYA